VLVIAGLGVALGLPAAWWLTRYVESQLFGVQKLDPVTLASACALLAAVALAAGLVPSTRAARVAPTTALRYE
jgi:ABC-type lipoprotein release transport system permease subunit